MQGAASRCVPGTPSRQRTFRGREGVKLGACWRRGAQRPQQPPNSEQNFLAPCLGSPHLPGPWTSGVEGLRGLVRGGRASYGRLRAGTGREGDGGRGRNLELSRGTQRGHHGECGMDGRTIQWEHGVAAPARGGRQWEPHGEVGGTAPRGVDSPPLPSASR